MTIRRMTHADIPAGLHLCRLSNWNQLEDDWRVFLDRGGAFLAVQEDGAAIGSVAHLPFGRDFAWLSMMLVDPAARRSGLGTKLMEMVLEALAGEACVRLDATPAGEPLYRRFDFQNEYRLARAQASGGRGSARVRPIRTEDLPEICARDREVFGADRGALLADLYRRAPEFAYRMGNAYCFGRPGHIYPQIGPVVADDGESARELAGHCLAAHAGQTFFCDIPERDDGLEFEAVRPFLRMSLGTPRRHGIPEKVFAITGPEFG